MIVMIEEIVKGHPAGSKAGEFRRITLGENTFDGPIESLVVDSEIWISSDGPQRFRELMMLTMRYVFRYRGGNQIAILIDVASPELFREISKDLGRGPYDPKSERDFYIEWATKHEVWP